MRETMIAVTKRLGSITTLVLAAAALLAATSPVPRKSPEFDIAESSGKQISLSSLRGKVVVLEFLLTRCPHCMRVAKMIDRLNKELGPRGFQPVGVAFDVDINSEKVTAFAQQLGITYPIGLSSSRAVDFYLGRAATERLMVPQIVVIDRNGIVRAQSRPVREVNLEDEAYLHELIQTLTKEPVAVGGTSRKTSRPSPHK